MCMGGQIRKTRQPERAVGVAFPMTKEEQAESGDSAKGGLDDEEYKRDVD